MKRLIDLIIIAVLVGIVIFLGYHIIINNLASITELILVILISILFILILFLPFFIVEENHEENT